MSTNRTKQVKADQLKPRISFLKRYWQSIDSSYRRSIVYALILHLAVVVLLGSGWSSQADIKPIAVPRHINAVVVDASAIDALKKQEADKKKKQIDTHKKKEERLKKELEKKKALEKKKKAEQKKKSDAEKKKVLAKKKALEKKKKDEAQKKALLKKKEEQKKLKDKKQREEQKKKDAEEKRIKEQKIKDEKAREQALQRKQQEAQLQEMMLKAEQARQQALDDRLREQKIEADRQRQEQLKADQIAEMNEVDRFIALIRAKITRNWHKPSGAKIGETVVLQLHLFPTGELSRAEILKSSGSSIFDSSALSAAKSIAKYPVPTDNRVFERNFRRFSMSFSHQED